ncbi:MAG: hypothetical protein KDC46_00245 [Thermoleophilia bacterium]|nr:hypothetical protein [Thermoleophilia bacterium]
MFAARVDAWVPALRTAMSHIDEALGVARQGSSGHLDELMRAVNGSIREAATTPGVDALGGLGVRRILDAAADHADEATKLLRNPYAIDDGVRELASTRFAVDLLLPYGPR